LLPNGRELPNGETVENVAREIGASPRTYYRVLSIIKRQPEEIKHKLRQGKFEINTAYANLQPETKRKQLIAMSKRPLPSPVKIVCGDYRQLWSEHIEDGTARPAVRHERKQENWTQQSSDIGNGSSYLKILRSVSPRSKIAKLSS
jgi:hypothetical protein